jgi:hypothetical protein
VCFESEAGTDDVLRARAGGGGDWWTLGGKPVIFVPENIVSIVTALRGPVEGPMAAVCGWGM